LPLFASSVYVQAIWDPHRKYAWHPQLVADGGVALVMAWESSEVSVSRAGFLSPTLVDYTTGCVWAFQCV
jgi:hypothetical protein